MFWLDTLMLALLALGAALGFYSGFLWQIARILTLAVALAVTIYFNDAASQYCRDSLLREADPRVSQVLAYIGVFLFVYIVLFLATRLVYAGIRATEMEAMDRLLGALLGAGKMALILGVLCLAAANYPQPTMKDWMAKSTLAPLFAEGMEHSLAIIPEDYKNNLHDTLLSWRDLFTKPTT